MLNYNLVKRIGSFSQSIAVLAGDSPLGRGQMFPLLHDGQLKHQLLTASCLTLILSLFTCVICEDAVTVLTFRLGASVGRDGKFKSESPRCTSCSAPIHMNYLVHRASYGLSTYPWL